MRIPHERQFPYGLTEIGARTTRTLMNFGILRLKAGQSYTSRSEKERALILLDGNVELSWSGEKRVISRESLFDQAPWCLSLPSGGEAVIKAQGRDAEISVHATKNNRSFTSHLYTPEECRSEERGKGTMKETSTRIVRTIIEDPKGAHSNFVLGEVITFPGKWSSYPPHHHPQPEIYHYRFERPDGFGLCQIGNDAYLLRPRDTIIIPPGAVHPHAAAPGYAMYYIWVIRHLDGNRYGTPTFVPEHTWVTDPKAKIWGS
ncbi:MAG TPA: 5-deoxy-glucuronate isomerase [Spirochaetia bacterium]|nr:5-deoxy-glucuronate isomerase [Spirochaetia bacterium]